MANLSLKENHIINETRKVMEAMGIKRMPSRSDIEMITHSSSLTNLISKNGGFFYFADKMNLELKNSATKEVIKYENKCIDYLSGLGLNAEPTPVKFPYDILVNKTTKIDVKISNGYKFDKSFWYTFNLESDIPRCDIFVFYCVLEKNIYKTLIIPSNILAGIRQLSVGKTSMYDVYINKWDYIVEHNKAINKIFFPLKQK